MCWDHSIYVLLQRYLHKVLVALAVDQCFHSLLNEYVFKPITKHSDAK